jgi:tRNA(Ile)-lysidine synthase
MLQKFQENINQNLPFLKESKLLLAVSGGLDSMVLLHLCQASNFDIGVAHCNFQLRGDESNEDEKFIKRYCQEHKIPLFVTHFDTDAYVKERKQSVQVVARNLRYDFFHSIVINNDYDYILTAHHLNDSLETFLINFTRGTGLDGLTGIPQQNEKVVRTLVPFSKIEIEEYAIKNGIHWREDSSNQSVKYQRNKFRYAVIPVLQEQNINLLQSFQNTLHYLKQAQSMVLDASELIYKKVVTEEETIKISLTKLLAFSNYKAYLHQWLAPFGFTAWDDIYNLVSAQSGKRVLSENFILVKDRNFFILFPKQNEDQSVHYLIKKDQKEVKFPLKLSLCNVDYISNAGANTIFVDEGKIKFSLQIRKWQEGDIFFPFGMKGSKKVSKYFKDEKYSLFDKYNTWLLSSDNEIVWIIGKRQDNRYRITDKTTQILQIQYTP